MKINKDNIENTSRDALKDKVANLKRLQEARLARQSKHQQALEQKRLQEAVQNKPDILAKYSDLLHTDSGASDSVVHSLSDAISASEHESHVISTSLSESESVYSSESDVEAPLLSEMVEPEKPLTAVEKLKARLANKNNVPASSVEPGAVALEPVVNEPAPVSESVEKPTHTNELNEPAPVSEPVEESTTSVSKPIDEKTSVMEPVSQDTTPLNITDKLSDTQYDAPAIVVPDDPDNSENVDDTSKSAIKWYKRKPVIISGVVGLIAVAILGAFVASRTINNHKADSTSTSVSTSKSSSTSSSSKSLSYEDALKEKLNKEASQSKIEHTVNVSDIGGGYLLGTVTYYPNDASKSYIDYSLTKPEHATEVTKDDTATKIEEELKSKLPTINDTIKVKDKDKVTMETYKLEDGTYSTILLYDKKPFAYVTSDSDLNMVNHVTTYYVSDVAAS